MESHGNGVVDLGRFLTGFFVVMGIGKSDEGASRLDMRWNYKAQSSRKHQSANVVQRSQPSSGIRRKSQEAQRPCPFSVVS
jgi:hypothetical protein